MQASDHFEHMDAMKEQIPEDYHDTFETLVGQGASPSGVAASIEYMVDGEATQNQISEKYEVSNVTIRSNLSAVCALEDIDRNEVSGQGKRTGTKKRIEYVEDLADKFGWEAGTDYKTSDQPHDQDGILYKQAIIDLHREHCQTIEVDDD